jgi:sec-independent protein translocase protein TatB
MFEISWSELLILAIVTLVFVRPADLPVFMRTIGRYAGAMKRQAAEMRGHFDTAMREVEFEAMKKEMETMQASVNAEVMGAKTALDDAASATVPVGEMRPNPLAPGSMLPPYVAPKPVQPVPVEDSAAHAAAAHPAPVHPTTVHAHEPPAATDAAQRTET